MHTRRWIPALVLALATTVTGCGSGAHSGGSAPTPPRSVSTTDAPGIARMPEDASTDPIISSTGYDITPLTDAQKAPLVAKLTPEQARITQKAGTERPFCGTLLDNKMTGAYHCVVCDLPLFSSSNKFDSGTGWPSFNRAVDADHVARTPDESHGMVRVEISCARCDAHLGHVFPDGPPPTGERHCLNSEALVFVEQDAAPASGAQETAYFAGGCFWGIEHYFQQGLGVLDAQSGYMNGQVDNPTYRQVCFGDTGHAEAVKVTFNPSVISYERLLQAFFDMHDPTQVDRQGPDIGTQYRSGIYTINEAQTTAARKFIDDLNRSGRFSRPVATEVEQAATFYPAEDYHQDYIEKTGRPCHVADPWRDKGSP